MAKQKKKRLNSRFGEPQRLQRVMAAAGFGSRRECEKLIEAGRVEVDGVVVQELGVKVDANQQVIHVDGERLQESRLQYFMLNKPPGVLSTVQDPSGRLRVVDLINTDMRVYNVGRLDKSSEGMILVTNDGDLANLLTHPRYGVSKTYHVLVRGMPDRETLNQMKKGVYLAEAKVQVAKVRSLKKTQDGCWLEIVLDEGRNREIRRLLARLGHKVVRLCRVAIGPLPLGDLPVGAHRRLTLGEVDLLRRVAGKPTRARKRVKKKATGGTERARGKKKVGKSGGGRKRAAGPAAETRRKKTVKRKAKAGAKAGSSRGAKKKPALRGGGKKSIGRSGGRAKPAPRKKSIKKTRSRRR
ncbi:MAG: pseudouridine synthase [Planctomycetota bacterium]|nr:pseudouridine synthase [Planctomycetota bacterium]